MCLSLVFSKIYLKSTSIRMRLKIKYDSIVCNYRREPPGALNKQIPGKFAYPAVFPA